MDKKKHKKNQNRFAILKMDKKNEQMDKKIKILGLKQ